MRERAGVKTVVFTGGGTAGHVFPGLAVAAALGADIRVVWIGSRKGMERHLVEERAIPYIGVPAGKWRRYLSLRNLSDLLSVVAGFASSVVHLMRLRPAALFSKGGYVSVPPVLAARFLGIPIATHESDLDPGLATRINARFADRILVSYTETVDCFPPALRRRVRVTGNPVRSAFWAADSVRGREWLGCPEDPILMVLGGSSGARPVNDLILRVKDQLVGRFCVVHQMGASDFSRLRPAPSLRYRPFAFLGDELADLLAACELAVTRAGAGTLAELAATGTPAVLIPLSLAGSRGDQVRNAAHWEAAGAARVFPQNGEPARLLALVESLATDRDALADMRKALAGRAAANSAELIAAELRGLVG